MTLTNLKYKNERKNNYIVKKIRKMKEGKWTEMKSIDTEFVKFVLRKMPQFPLIWGKRINYSISSFYELQLN
jgi:hypothetical protein